MKRFALLGAGLLLSACQMVGPDYSVPKEAAVNRGDLQGALRSDADSLAKPSAESFSPHSSSSTASVTRACC